MRRTAQLTSLEQRHRPLTDGEVIGLLLSKQVNAMELDDNTALRMVQYYPVWTVGADYATGFAVNRGGQLWRCLQGHTAQTGWEPENTAALWEQVCFHYTGTAHDPIPYEGNMRLENGKHYIQNDVIYLCSRDTGNPVHHPLAELVGLYVEAV